MRKLAVQAATESLPKPLTTVWTIMLETEYITACRPPGMPIARVSFRMGREIRISRRARWQLSFRRISATVTMAALMASEITVAMAAPAAPPLHTATNRRSSTTLIRQLAMRKYSGLLESPTARKIPAPTL